MPLVMIDKKLFDEIEELCRELERHQLWPALTMAERIKTEIGEKIDFANKWSPSDD